MRYFALLVLFPLFAFAFTLTNATEYHPLRTHFRYAKKLGEYATSYWWDKEGLAWAKHFAIAEVGGLDEIDPSKLEGFHKVIAYEWMAGFYKAQRREKFFRDLYLHKARWTLNPYGPHFTDQGDFYYDMCQPQLQRKRVAYLVKKVHELGIDGIFFDWANGRFLEEEKFRPMREVFSARHPHRSYGQCIGEFLEKLRREGVLIVTNQACSDEVVLDSTDYDMIESEITTDEEGRTIFSPIDATYSALQKFMALRTKHRLENIIFLDYATPKWSKEAIYYAYAFAKLFGAIAYTEIPAKRALEREEVYFAALGHPLSSIVPIEVPKGYIRFFQRGFVTLFSPTKRDLFLRIGSSFLHARHILDMKEAVWLSNEKGVVVKIKKSLFPRGKVFVYEDTHIRQ